MVGFGFWGWRGRATRAKPGIWNESFFVIGHAGTRDLAGSGGFRL